MKATNEAISKDVLRTTPSLYISGYGIINRIGKIVMQYGSRVFVYAGVRAYSSIESVFETVMEDEHIDYMKLVQSSECSEKSIAQLKLAAQEYHADVLVCAGGGKALDTGKAAAYYLGIPIVCIPTICATCASASAVVVQYTEDGFFEKDIYLEKNPDCVICDYSVIGAAPVIYLKSGICDSLAKWYEGKAASESLKYHDVPVQSALALAKMLKECLIRNSLEACKSCETQIYNKALEQVIDICIYITALIQGLSQKHLRGAAAHPIEKALSYITGNEKVLHGYKVAYGIIVQSYLEKKPIEYIEELCKFFLSIGVEPSLSSFGIQANERICLKVANEAINNVLMRNMPCDVCVEDVLTAIENTNEIINRLMNHF